MMKKVWTDPVWSKVIASTIITVGFFILSIIYSLLTDKTVEESLNYFWSYHVPLGPTILGVIVILLLIATVQRLIKKQPSRIERLEKRFQQENTEMVDGSVGVTCRYNAYISSYTNYPFISDLRLYCTGNNHPQQLMTQHSGCPIPSCRNNGQGYNEHNLKTTIETYLLQVWDRMKNSA